MKKSILVLMIASVLSVGLNASEENRKTYSQTEAIMILNETVKKLVIDNKSINSKLNELSINADAVKAIIVLEERVSELENKVSELEKLGNSNTKHNEPAKTILLDNEILEFLDEKN
jgi:TolA-binding protein